MGLAQWTRYIASPAGRKGLRLTVVKPLRGSEDAMYRVPTPAMGGPWWGGEMEQN